MEQFPVTVSVCTFTEPFTFSGTGYTLLYLLEGSLHIHTDSDLWSMQEGDMILLSPDDAAGVVPNTVNKALMAQIDDAFLQRITGTPAPVFLLNTVSNRCDCSALEKLLQQMLSEHAADTSDSLKGAAYAYEMLFLLKSQYLISSGISDAAPTDASRLAQLKRYMLTHYAQKITLEDAAGHFGLTTAYFSRYFKRQFGVTFSDYLTDLRLRHAYQKLITSDRDITTIALESGFTNLSSFYHAFRRTYHMTPKELRTRKPRQAAITVLPPADALPLMEAHSSSRIIDDRQASVFAKMNVQVTVENRQSWKQILNAGFAMNCLKWDLQHQINEISHRLRFRYIRIDSILTDRVTPMIQPGRYDFSYLERIITGILDSGCLPMLELGDCQSWAVYSNNAVVFQQTGLTLSSSQWLEKLSLLLKWIAGRWSAAETWRFSLFAERAPEYPTAPELLREYCTLFAQTRTLLTNYIPGALLGGPGIADTISEEALRHLLTAMDQSGGTPDYITALHFPAYLEQTHTATKRSLRLLYTGESAQHRAERLRHIVTDIFGQEKPIYIVSANCEQLVGRAVNDCCHKAAWFTQTAISCQVDGLAYAVISDLQTPSHRPGPGPLLFGGQGMLTSNSIPKPLYHAMEMLHALGPKLVRRGDHFMVTKDDSGVLTIIMHNCKQFSQAYLMHPEETALSDSYEDLRNLQVILLMEELCPGTYHMKTTILNEQHGSILHALTVFGKSENLSPQDYAYLCSTSIPQQQYRTVTCGPTFQLEAMLVPNEVRLVQISPKQ